jgi:2-keto-3-deoxy-L-rhamnonate aldolase RhmA
VDSQSLGTLARDNVVGISAGATATVSGMLDAGAQQVVVPVTLTYR